MNLYRVSDLELDDVTTRKYDLVLLASGYEERCTFAPAQLRKLSLPPAKSIVLGFEEMKDDTQRLVNDQYFVDQWSGPTILSSGDDGPVYELLRKEFGYGNASLKILIDYSSMSRLWYTGVLNWARFYPGEGEIIIDMLYSVGHHKVPSRPLVISDILSLPGCEGVPLPLSRSVAIFGLGFEGAAALCVLDRLEPDALYCYLAAPAAFDDYPERARTSNKAVIEMAKACLDLPLGSVERCFGNLAELISQHRVEGNVTLVPMGPKPHVLASILLAMRFEEICCLRVAYMRHTPSQVGTNGDIVCTRVQFTTLRGTRANGKETERPASDSVHSRENN